MGAQVLIRESWYKYVPVATSYQRAEMLTHHALEMLKRRTGSTKAPRVKLVELWYHIRRIWSQAASVIQVFSR